MLVLGDSLEYMREQPDLMFSAASFSPPYAAHRDLFDVRCDFREDGRFIPFALELSRICTIWAINLTQLTYNKHLLPFTEELTLCMRDHGVELFDRWVCHKPMAMPARGNRALSNYEFVLLFSAHPLSVQQPASRVYTAFKMEFGDRDQSVSGTWDRWDGSSGRKTTLTPYSRAIPRTVFSAYAVGDPRPVLDPFCGSGTTLLEAQALGLSYVGVEILPENIALCQKRGLE